MLGFEGNQIDGIMNMVDGVLGGDLSPKDYQHLLVIAMVLILVFLGYSLWKYWDGQ